MAFSALKLLVHHSTLLFFAMVLLYFLKLGVSEGDLKVGFYSQTCPKAESIVMSVVKEAAMANPRIPAMLLRLHFHDCYVEGCDGSILIDNVENPEKKAFGHEGVGGFEEIAKAKEQLETECPGVVSCADIIALAARDSIILSKGPSYEVPTGRRDGRVSNESLGSDFPDVNEPILSLKTKFKKRGLSKKDLVLLSAAHTIGTTACFFMPTRLYNFAGGKDDSDPSINPSFLPKLKSMCPKDGDANTRIPIDIGTNHTFDDQILRNIKNGCAVIASDARLFDDVNTKQVIESYVDPTDSRNGTSTSFHDDFVASIVKMGKIGVKTGSEGEIRKICNSFN